MVWARNQLVKPGRLVKCLILNDYFFLGLIILLFWNACFFFSDVPFFSFLAFLSGAVPPCLPTCIADSLLEAPPARIVLALLIAVCLATLCRFWAILAPLSGCSLALQVPGLATILPFLGPSVHLKPCFRPLPLTRLNILLMPSAMAEPAGMATISCGTRSCVWVGLIELAIFGPMISDIFI